MVQKLKLLETLESLCKSGKPWEGLWKDSGKLAFGRPPAREILLWKPRGSFRFHGLCRELSVCSQVRLKHARLELQGQALPSPCWIPEAFCGDNSSSDACAGLAPGLALSTRGAETGSVTLTKLYRGGSIPCVWDPHTGHGRQNLRLFWSSCTGSILPAACARI